MYNIFFVHALRTVSTLIRTAIHLFWFQQSPQGSSAHLVIPLFIVWSSSVCLAWAWASSVLLLLVTLHFYINLWQPGCFLDLLSVLGLPPAVILRSQALSLSSSQASCLESLLCSPEVYCYPIPFLKDLKLYKLIYRKSNCKKKLSYWI